MKSLKNSKNLWTHKSAPFKIVKGKSNIWSIIWKWYFLNSVRTNSFCWGLIQETVHSNGRHTLDHTEVRQKKAWGSQLAMISPSNLSPASVFCCHIVITCRDTTFFNLMTLSYLMKPMKRANNSFEKRSNSQVYERKKNSEYIQSMPKKLACFHK